MIAGSGQCTAFFLFCDIRGFSRWMAENQLEARDLLDIYYTAAFRAFGERKERTYHRRVAKLLGDGFFAVHEYDRADSRMFAAVLKALVAAVRSFTADFEARLGDSTIHGKHRLKTSFGLAYGPAVRFAIPGYPLDYISHKINLASRYAGVAAEREVVFEADLLEHMRSLPGANARLEQRELKKMGQVDVGVYQVKL